MILERTEWNNGYGCSCCSQSSEESEWIEESDMKSFTEIIEEAYKSTLDGTVSLQYERDGKVIYGYISDINRAGSDVYVIKDSMKIQITRSCEPIMTKEEFISRFLKEV